MKKAVKIIGIFLLVILICIGLTYLNTLKTQNKKIAIDITNLIYEADGNSQLIKVYEVSDYEEFVKDFNNKTLPCVYITKFLYDGAGMYKTYDLDDFIEDGNDVEIDVFETTVININGLGDYEISGTLTKGMIAVNTNNLKGDINLILNNVNLDTDSKKIPAIYVYNKDITYSKCNVTIVAKEGTSNYIEGGKLKKVSLIASSELENYASKYTKDVATWYNEYTNYYGIYSQEEIENILFATVTADNEDLADGDPYYYYKASGAISSDIDLNFNGAGYLEIISKNKEGVETKGHLSFVGGTGDYVIKAQDDCLNTTTSDSENSNAHNNLIIDVSSLTAIVDLEADEGDAIDSNGTLTINGGTIIALAKPGADAGLDSEKGTYINGGTVISTGNMYDQISSDSKQKFIVLSFGEEITEDQLIALLDENENLEFAYKTDRAYTYLVYSSNNLEDGNYSLYKNGEIDGNSNNGFYLEANYTKGTILGYSKSGVGQGPEMGGNMGTPPQRPDGENGGTPPERPDDNNGGTPPEKPEGQMDGTMPERPNDENGETPPENGENNMPQFGNNEISNPVNKDFNINGISNVFSGIGEYVENN